MKKLLLFLVLFSLLFLAACGTTNDNDDAGEQGNREDIQSEETAGTKNGNTNGEGNGEDDGGKDSVDPDTPVSDEGNNGDGDSSVSNSNGSDGQQTSGSEDIEYITEEGTYTGLMDPHSIEIMTDEGAIALQILDIEDVDFEELEKNLSVTFQYYETEEGQNILTSFEANE